MELWSGLLSWPLKPEAHLERSATLSDLLAIAHWESIRMMLLPSSLHHYQIFRPDVSLPRSKAFDARTQHLGGSEFLVSPACWLYGLDQAVETSVPPGMFVKGLKVIWYSDGHTVGPQFLRLRLRGRLHGCESQLRYLLAV